jgi:hypothetical protein
MASALVLPATHEFWTDEVGAEGLKSLSLFHRTLDVIMRVLKMIQMLNVRLNCDRHANLIMDSLLAESKPRPRAFSAGQAFHRKHSRHRETESGLSEAEIRQQSIPLVIESPASPF